MAVVGADTHQTLSGISTGDADVLETVIGLREANREGSGLDPRSFALVKIAALIALDAPPSSGSCTSPACSLTRSSQPRRRGSSGLPDRLGGQGQGSGQCRRSSAPASGLGPVQDLGQRLGDEVSP